MRHGSNKYRGSTIVFVFLMLLSSCYFPPKSPPLSEFYVSVKGSDVLGDGSKSNPWRHIQYAIDHAKPKSGSVLRINILKGIYEETLVIHKALELVGVGIGTASTWANDPLYPIQEVSVISGSINVDSPDILIENATSVKLQNLVVYYGGIRVVNTRFIMYQVEIPDTRGLYGVQIESSSLFYIDKSQIKTLQNTKADYAVDIMASSGDIWNTYLGDNFDHTINILPHVLGGPGPSLTQSIKIPTVNIYDSTIEGSGIYYADGIRIQGATNVKIVNTKITRASGGAAAANTGTPYNTPYAGIEIGGWITEVQGHALVEIEGSTISGFNIGIGMSPEGFDVKAQNNTISGIKYDVETNYTGYTNAGLPVIDFGGGPLGSAGENNFAVQSPYAFYNDVPYDVYACYNEWNVPVTNVDDARIFDKLDLPSKGRVNWLCAQQSIFQLTPTIARRPTMITTERVRITRDTLCYEGPGPGYPVVSSVLQNQTANLIGIGFGNTYYVIENPTFVVPCWVDITSVEYDGDVGILRIIAVPPTQTPTKAPEEPEPPTATPLRGP